MDVVELPIVSIDASLRDVFQTMKNAGVSAVVVLLDKTAFLCKAGDVVLGIDAGKQTLRDLEQKWPVVIPSGSHLAQPDLDWVTPHQTAEAFETLLGSFNLSYLLALRPTVHTRTRVITLHESLAAEIGTGPVRCYCTNTNTGPHPCDPVPADQKCGLCGMSIKCI
jgi:hypothetical protein